MNRYGKGGKVYKRVPTDTAKCDGCAFDDADAGFCEAEETMMTMEGESSCYERPDEESEESVFYIWVEEDE